MTLYAYCPTCNTAVEFTCERRYKMTDYQGQRYRYPIRQAICTQCGGHATYPPYTEENGIAFNNCVRNELGLISLERIREIPKRYDIGKRPLSKVLGFGEHTYTQLMEGQAPTQEHSRLLEHVFDDPCYYLSLLEEHRGSVSDATYERSRRAVKAYMRESSPDSYRIYEIGRAFVRLAQCDITAMAIQKLAYYYQGFSKAMLGRRAFSNMPHAWADGPVYGQLRHEFRVSPSDYFTYREDEDYSSPFTPGEDELIHAIHRHFGCYSGSILSSMTRTETPWQEARRRADAKAEDRCNESITAYDMDTYFDRIVREYGIDEPRHIGRYARAKFEEVTGRT